MIALAFGNTVTGRTLIAPYETRLPPHISVEHMLARADAGYVQDQIDLALAFQSGKGVKRYPAKAAQWFLKAANSGDPVAQAEISYLYFTGEGVSRNEQEGFIINLKDGWIVNKQSLSNAVIDTIRS